MSRSWLILVLVCLAGCARVSHVSRDYDSAYNFARLASYTVEKQPAVSENATKIDNQLMDNRLDRSMVATLNQKGYFLSATPDFIAQYGYYIKSVIESDPYADDVGVGFGSMFGRRAYSGVSVGSGSRVAQREVGIFVIDILDAQTQELVWQGKTSSRVLNYDQPEMVSQEVLKAVQEILQHFPPQF